MAPHSADRSSFLLQRLAEGVITEDELAELKQLATSDPFLSEAMEGYLFSQGNHRQHLQAIRAQMNTRKGISGSAPLAVAAGLALLLGMATIYLIDQQSHAEFQVAVVEEEDDNVGVTARKMPSSTDQHRLEGQEDLPSTPLPEPAGENSGIDAVSDRVSAKKQVKRNRFTRKESEASIAPSSADQAPPSTVSPQNGWQDYNAYLTKYLQYPLSAEKNGVEGIVELSFSVNSEGRPSEIQVVKSLGFGCDQEAIRLLQEGANWTAPTDSSEEILGMVEIPFKLK